MTGRGAAERHYDERLLNLMSRSFEWMDASEFIDPVEEGMGIGTLDELKDAWMTENAYLRGDDLGNEFARLRAINAMLNRKTEVEDRLLDFQNEAMSTLSTDEMDMVNEIEKGKIPSAERYIWTRTGPRVFRVSKRGRIMGAFRA